MRFLLVILAALAVLGIAVAATLARHDDKQKGTGEGTTTASTTGTSAAGLTGEIVRKDKTWKCDGAVDLDLVKVTITTAKPGREGKDAVLLRGCSGRIGRLVINNAKCDGVKGRAKNLVIESGSITLTRKTDLKCHVDAFQITSGSSNVHVRNMIIRGTGHSGFFVNGGHNGKAPTDITLEDSFVGTVAGKTPFDTDVTIGQSEGSGVRNSTLCPVKQHRVYVPRSPSTGGPPAASPINEGNTFPAAVDCAPTPG
jgi:hypothetical protein